MTRLRIPYKITKAILFTVLVGLIILATAGAGYRYAESKDFYFEEINTIVRNNAGYTLHKPAPLTLSLWPRLKLGAKSLKIINPAVDPNRAIAEVERVSLALQWLPLLRLSLVLDVELETPQINLKIDATGQPNWMNEELLTITGGLPFELDKIDMWKTAFRFKNDQTNEILSLDLEQFALDLTHGTTNARIESAGDLAESRFFALGNAAFRQDAYEFNVDLEISAVISGYGKYYKIERADLELQGGNIRTKITGSLDLVDGIPRFDLDANLNIDNTIELSAFLPQLTDPLLQDVKLTATSKITGTLKNFSLSKLSLDISRDDRLWSVWGAVEQLPHNPAANVDFKFSTREPIKLEQYFPKLGPLEVTGPLDLTGTIRGSDNQIRIVPIVLRAEQTDIAGDITIDLATVPPRIYAVMKSRQLYTRLIVADPDTEAEVQPAGAAKEALAESESVAETKGSPDPEGLFKAYTNAVKIETAWIKDLNIYFSLSALKARLGNYDLENLSLTLDAREGVFKLVEYEVELQGRPMSFSGTIDTNIDPPTYAFSGEIEGDTLEALLSLKENVLIGGALSADFDLDSKGNTLGELLEQLNGTVLLNMGPFEIRSKALNLVSSDILSSMLRGITRKKEEQPTSSYRCAVLGVDILNGIATANKSFAMEAKDYNLAGQGKVDLNTGYIDLAVFPKASKGLGLNVSTLVGGFNAQGNMATPNFRMRGGGLLTAMIAGYAVIPTVAAAMATNPATATILVTGFLAKGIIDRLTASDYSCQSILKKIERNRAAKGTT